MAAKPGNLLPDKLKKSDETRDRILEAALSVFREHSFEKATMRQVAAAAGVASGAAYYYFESKDALVLAFYQRAQEEMTPAVEAEMSRARTLEGRLRAIISAKLNYFRPNRGLLSALTAHTDPEHPLSPFSARTAAIREQDVAAFERAVDASDVKLPATLAPYLGRVLWMYQMGLILFWIYDRSPEQARTALLYDKSLQLITLVLKVAGNPLLRPLHRVAGELLAVVFAD